MLSTRHRKVMPNSPVSRVVQLVRCLSRSTEALTWPSFSPDEAAERAPFTTLKFMEPMYATLVNALLMGKDWLYEVKFDGYHCLVGRDSSGVRSLVEARKPFHKTIPAHCPSR
jgi:ATP-dependent DNA ligase